MRIKTETINIILLITAILFVSIQLICFLSAILKPIVPASSLSTDILPEFMVAIYPKWDLVLYIVFIILSVSFYVTALILWSNRLADRLFMRSLWWWFLIEAALTFLLVSAFFKMIIYDNSPTLAQTASWIILILLLIHKLFHEQFLTFIRYILRIGRIPTALAFIAIAAIIYIPDLHAVFAMMFLGESLHHIDFFIMSPGWAVINGNLPYIGVMSQYGVGIPVILSQLAKFTTGFDYLALMHLMMAMVIIYYLGLFVFVRNWLGSAAWGLIVFLLAFRLQMLHYGVSPLVWTYPSATPLRFGADLIWMACLLAYSRKGLKRYLMAAAVYSGIAIYYMTSTGLCVVLAFYAFLLMVIFFQKKPLWYLLFVLITPIVTLILFLITIGNQIWQPLFWNNMFEYMNYFSHGHAGGALPIYESLKYRHYWASIMSFVLPLTWVFTAIYFMLKLWWRQDKGYAVFIITLCVYGLLNYQYYVVRSAVTTYYVSALPFVLVVCFWIYYIIQHWSILHKRAIVAVVLAVSVYALVTNHNYISYPNIFNFSKNPVIDPLVMQRWPDRQGYFHHMVKFIKPEDKVVFNNLGNTQEALLFEDDFKTQQQLKQYVDTQFDFKEDAALIAQLVPQDIAVALISSFETRILMQAARKPLFYHFPLISSRPMTLRTWPADAAHSPRFLEDTLKQLREQQPEYVFMEKVFLLDNIPASYAENNGNIVAIIKYVKSHYAPLREGRYLVAMKRL